MTYKENDTKIMPGSLQIFSGNQSRHGAAYCTECKIYATKKGAALQPTPAWVTTISSRPEWAVGFRKVTSHIHLSGRKDPHAAATSPLSEKKTSEETASVDTAWNIGYQMSKQRCAWPKAYGSICYRKQLFVTSGKQDGNFWNQE